ncbi:hypothetical protein KIN20_034055 [Parelaphostrongylus tenuis]|uniref:Uncharacterized protein n=1 Tax=Parelaphostrongylus tenuis TaxID=148309 RepID=A0AAD5R9Q7_PARTN|nr:hypothetical protein KIN20_034055 [Parelaphostrongylus tenuis]
MTEIVDAFGVDDDDLQFLIKQICIAVQETTDDLIDSEDYRDHSHIRSCSVVQTQCWFKRCANIQTVFFQA